MGALSRSATVFALALALGIGPCLAREESGWRAHVTAAAARFGLPEAWVLRVIAAESGGRTHRGGKPITSHAGAMGLMQVMPVTWAELRTRYGLGPDPHDPRDNIVAGTAYLREMYDLFGYPGLFAAYNAGPRRYRDHLTRGRPLPRETRDYVAKLTGQKPAPRFAVALQKSARDSGVRPLDALFFACATPGASTQRQQYDRPGTPAIGRTDEQIGAGAQQEPLFFVRKPAPVDER